MPYLSDHFPPIIHITGETEAGEIVWQLESQTGATVQTYTTEDRPTIDVWYDDLLNAFLDAETIPVIIHDLVRLSLLRDWVGIDDRENMLYDV